MTSNKLQVDTSALQERLRQESVTNAAETQAHREAMLRLSKNHDVQLNTQIEEHDNVAAALQRRHAGLLEELGRVRDETTNTEVAERRKYRALQDAQLAMQDEAS